MPVSVSHRLPKSLPPVWFYDERGSALFEAITELPEYYLTRAEHSILSEHGHEIVERAGCHTLVELGSGSSQKTRLLLDAMGRERPRPFRRPGCERGNPGRVGE